MCNMVTNIEKVTKKELAHKPILSAAQLQEIEDDPSKMETVARLMGAVNLDNLFRHMQNPTLNPATRIEFQKLLNKMGKLEPEDSISTDGGPQVIINITRARDGEAEPITIEGKAVDA